jgi:hypothetical protein
MYFAPHALHQLIMIIFYICDGSRGAEDGNWNAASLMGVRGSTSVKLREDANIVVTKVSPGESNPILEFYYNCILIMILACALGYRSWIDVVAALAHFPIHPCWSYG